MAVAGVPLDVGVGDRAGRTAARDRGKIDTAQFCEAACCRRCA
jgi:hypothetical protein